MDAVLVRGKVGQLFQKVIRHFDIHFSHWSPPLFCKGLGVHATAFHVLNGNDQKYQSEISSAVIVEEAFTGKGTGNQRHDSSAERGGRSHQQLKKRIFKHSKDLV